MLPYLFISYLCIHYIEMKKYSLYVEALREIINKELINLLFIPSKMQNWHSVRILAGWILLIIMAVISWKFAITCVILTILMVTLWPRNQVQNYKRALDNLQREFSFANGSVALLVVRRIVAQAIQEHDNTCRWDLVGTQISLKYEPSNSLCTEYIIGDIVNIREAHKVGGYNVEPAYIVHFDKDVVIDNRYPRNVYWLTLREIQDIEAEKITGTDIHFIDRSSKN